MSACEPGTSKNGRSRSSEERSDGNNGDNTDGMEEEFAGHSKLLELSDEILLEILKNLDSPALYSFSKCCIRFRDLVKEKKLWVEFDFSTHKLTAMELLKRMKYLNAETKTFKIRGMASKYPFKGWDNSTITKNMLTILNDNCPNLESFLIVEGFIDFNKLNIQNFPQSLTILELNKCEVPKHKMPQNFFKKIDTHMKELNELSLQNNYWFETHDLVLFSKLPQLRVLNLNGCVSMTHCVPYASIASRYGFKKLESLDLRNTPVSDSDIQCFNITQTLKELLLECPKNLRDDVRAPNVPTQTSRKRRRRPSTDASSSVSKSDSHQDSEYEDSSSESDPLEIPPYKYFKNMRPNEMISIQLGGRQANGSSNIQDNVNEPSNSRENPNNPEEPPIQPAVQPPENIENHQGVVLPAVNAVEPANLNDEGVSRQNQLIVRHRAAFGPIIIISGPNPAINQQMQLRMTNYSRPARHRTEGAATSEDDDDEDESDEDNPNNRNHCGNRIHPGFFTPSSLNLLISDRGICSYGVSPLPNWVWIRAEARNPNNSLERLVVRNYKRVTDNSLRHLGACSPNLVFLDVCGTSVTMDGVEQFKLIKPNCVVLSDHS